MPGHDEDAENPPVRRSAAQPRTPRRIIDQAIEENKFGEYLLYAFATAFVLCGIAFLIVGLVRKEALVTLAGGISSTLFYPAINKAWQIRRENIAVRLIERALDKAETSQEAAEMLTKFFANTFMPPGKDK